MITYLVAAVFTAVALSFGTISEKGELREIRLTLLPRYEQYPEV